MQVGKEVGAVLVAYKAAEECLVIGIAQFADQVLNECDAIVVILERCLWVAGNVRHHGHCAVVQFQVCGEQHNAGQWCVHQAQVVAEQRLTVECQAADAFELSLERA